MPMSRSWTEAWPDKFLARKWCRVTRHEPSRQHGGDFRADENTTWCSERTTITRRVVYNLYAIRLVFLKGKRKEKTPAPPSGMRCREGINAGKVIWDKKTGQLNKEREIKTTCTAARHVKVVLCSGTVQEFLFGGMFFPRMEQCLIFRF